MHKVIRYASSILMVKTPETIPMGIKTNEEAEDPTTKVDLPKMELYGERIKNADIRDPRSIWIW